MFLYNGHKESSIHTTVTRGRAKKVKRLTRQEFWLETKTKGKTQMNHWILRWCFGNYHYTYAMFLSSSLSCQDPRLDRCLVWPKLQLSLCSLSILIYQNWWRSGLRREEIPEKMEKVIICLSYGHNRESKI